mmetsp:Transcript_3457/g.6400  ORF Transcript_3457/g.6400 Transcript_3457/m.6400 type:complete len:387 (-) Transcript_3457:71-1231(-)
MARNPRDTGAVRSPCKSVCDNEIGFVDMSSDMVKYNRESWRYPADFDRALAEHERRQDGRIGTEAAHEDGWDSTIVGKESILSEDASTWDSLEFQHKITKETWMRRTDGTEGDVVINEDSMTGERDSTLSVDVTSWDSDNLENLTLRTNLKKVEFDVYGFHICALTAIESSSNETTEEFVLVVPRTGLVPRHMSFANGSVVFVWNGNQHRVCVQSVVEAGRDIHIQCESKSPFPVLSRLFGYILLRNDFQEIPFKAKFCTVRSQFSLPFSFSNQVDEKFNQDLEVDSNATLGGGDNEQKEERVTGMETRSKRLQAGSKIMVEEYARDVEEERDTFVETAYDLFKKGLKIVYLLSIGGHRACDEDNISNFISSTIVVCFAITVFYVS